MAGSRKIIIKLSALANILPKTREELQNTDLDMQELLEIDKALKSTQDKRKNNASK